MAQIDKPNLHFNTVTYTATGNDNLAITGVDFQPDLTWIKERSSTSSHAWWDAVRGVTKKIESDNDQVEGTDATGLKSFDSDGFTLGTSAQVNHSGVTNVAWNWLAGGGQGSANSDGTFATTYTSANQTAGFSISQFTVSGSGNVTFGHGLGAKPKVVITKSTSHTTNWNVYHEDLSASPENDYLYLNTSAAKGTSTDVWGDGMTTSVVGLGVGIGVSVGRTYVAYCFAEKKGYSKFGSYTGNGNANGTFVYTGFKPAWVLIKQTSASGEEWQLLDNKRNTHNPTNTALFPSDTAVENSGNDRSDFLSNGFKLRSTSGGVNASSATYIYMAFAENPIVGSNNVAAVAK